MTNDLSARISRAQLDIDTAALRQRIAELESELERLRAERWEPCTKANIVGFGTVLHLSDNVITLYDSKWGGGPLSDPYAYTFELTPDLALCRRKQGGTQ